MTDVIESGNRATERLPMAWIVEEYALVGQGKPMPIVHGAEGGFDQSIDMSGELAEQGYQLIAPSRFGYLRSTFLASARWTW